MNANQIVAIAPGSFAGMSRLKKISLMSNRLRTVERETFAGLSRLTSLSVKYNFITSFDPSVLIDGLRHLKTLDLRGNQLSPKNLHELREQWGKM